MRMPISGGPAAILLKGDFSYHCAVLAKICVVSEQVGDKHTFSLLDPLKGRGPQLAEFRDPPHATWALTPDGKRIALVFDTSQSKLHIINFGGDTSRVVEFRGTQIQSLAWAVDGQHVYVSGFIEQTPRIFRLGLDGESKTLLKDDFGRDWLALGDVSPDGHYLSYTVRSFESNVVLIENF